jgi:hypothetical protein
MGLFPSAPRSTLYSWVAARAAMWKLRSAQIGLTAAQADELAAALAAAQADNQAQVDAIEAARTATQIALASQRALRTRVSGLIGLIRAKAQLSGDPQVWDLALLPRPATPTPALPPAQPRALRVELDAATGSLRITWKARNPDNASGTSYVIYRKLPGQRDFVFLGTSGAKRFIDRTIPQGSDSVEYVVRGQRADVSGPFSQVLSVSIGVVAEDVARQSAQLAWQNRLDASASTGKHDGKDRLHAHVAA